MQTYIAVLQSRLKSIVTTAALTAFLIGCGNTDYNAPAYCPPLKSYPTEFSEQLADELERVETNSRVYTALADYKDLRELIKVCRKVVE